MGPRNSAVTALVTVLVLGCARPVTAQEVPVSGSVTNAAGQVVGTFEGVFKLQSFRAGDDELLARGKVSGVIKDADGTVVEKIKNVKVAFPVDLDESGFTEGQLAALAAGEEVEAAATEALLDCDVLHLVLGPLDLDLLGLEIHLNKVVLDIDADPTGGLLGSLLSILCGLSLGDILDMLLGDLGDLAALLNLILDLLG
jgi:hypothetical protein